VVPVSEGDGAVVHQVVPSERKPVALTVSVGGVLSATSDKVAVARLPAASRAIAVTVTGPSVPVVSRIAAAVDAPLSVSVRSESVRTGAGSVSSVATAVISRAPRTSAPGGGVAPKVTRGAV
jgi:hypothetical protein